MGQGKVWGGLGFRDIKNFDRTMLAKQLWRIVKHPDLIVSQVLRNKYFKNVNLLKAKFGQRPSYLWRSFVATLDLIKDGHFWRIEDGSVQEFG